MSINIPSPARVLMNSLQRFYSQKTNLDKFLFIRDKSRESGISLRTYDKYTTQYVSQVTVLFPGTDKSVHDSYREQLKSWTKNMFDPNARDHTNKKRKTKDDSLLSLFNLVISKVGIIEKTNIGQLNFFRWVIQNNIDKLIKKDLILIKAFIKSKNKEKKASKKIKEKKVNEKVKVNEKESMILNHNNNLVFN